MNTTPEVSEPASEPESGRRSVFHCPAVPLTVRDRPWTVPGAQVSAVLAWIAFGRRRDLTGAEQAICV